MAEVCLKLEFFNPGGSVKDRIGLSMLKVPGPGAPSSRDAQLIEPTSGNTGIGAGHGGRRRWGTRSPSSCPKP